VSRPLSDNERTLLQMLVSVDMQDSQILQAQAQLASVSDDSDPRELWLEVSPEAPSLGDATCKAVSNVMGGADYEDGWGPFAFRLRVSGGYLMSIENVFFTCTSIDEIPSWGKAQVLAA
jgi:hypothetical protein